MTPPAAVERVEWSTFLERFRWEQGEHVTLIGHTGAGKTTLALELLPLRSWVIALATKPKDNTMDWLVKREGWKLANTWEKVPNIGIRQSLRVVLWPRYRTPDDEPAQRWEIDNAIRNAFVQGGWTLFADELWYISNKLGLGRLLESVWTQGRSIGLTLVGGAQRPRDIPLLAYGQATHLFFWRCSDEYDLKRIGGLNGLNAGGVRATVASLPKHDVLYVNTRTGQQLVTRAPAK